MSTVLPLIVYFVLITSAVESLTNLVKALFPKRVWKSQRLWAGMLWILGFVFGYVIALAIPYADAFWAVGISKHTAAALVGVVCCSSSTLLHNTILTLTKGFK